MGNKKLKTSFYASYEKYSFKYYNRPLILGIKEPTVEISYLNDKHWVDTLQFKDKKDWYRFVRAVNNCNKLIKQWNLKIGE